AVPVVRPAVVVGVPALAVPIAAGPISPVPIGTVPVGTGPISAVTVGTGAISAVTGGAEPISAEPVGPAVVVPVRRLTPGGRQGRRLGPADRPGPVVPVVGAQRGPTVLLAMRPPTVALGLGATVGRLVPLPVDGPPLVDP